MMLIINSLLTFSSVTINRGFKDQLTLYLVENLKAYPI